MAAAAVVERNVYEKASMSIAVSGETDAEADTFLKDKLCEQGLKVIEVYAEWGGRCEPLVPVLKRIQKEAEYAQNCAVVLHCKAESHDLLAEYRGKSMPHFLFYRNGTRVASVAGANMPEIEASLKEHAPTAPDADVLEENPMWIQRQEEKAAAEAAAQAALMGENE